MNTIMDDFWGAAERNGECLEWQRCRNDYGYGRVTYNGRVERAHRVSYELMYGEIPDGTVIRHRCDNPACIHPLHLEAGTMQDNSNDMVSRGRHVPVSLPGEKHPMNRLSEDDILAIRSAPTGYGTGVRLAEKYGVTPAAISAIRKRKLWRHI